MFLAVIACNKDNSKIGDNNVVKGDVVTTVELPKRSGSRPETTMDVPHVQFFDISFIRIQLPFPR